MGVEGIARYQGSLELRGGVLVEEALGDGKFAVVFFAAVGALGEGLAGGVEAPAAKEEKAPKAAKAAKEPKVPDADGVVA